MPSTSTATRVATMERSRARAWLLVDTFVDLVSRWHDDHHDGAFVFCSVEPCHEVNRDFDEAVDDTRAEDEYDGVDAET